jgi:hypothetical protein
MECDVSMGLLGFRFSISQSEMNKKAVRIEEGKFILARNSKGGGSIVDRRSQLLEYTHTQHKTT